MQTLCKYRQLKYTHTSKHMSTFPLHYYRLNFKSCLSILVLPGPHGAAHDDDGDGDDDDDLGSPLGSPYLVPPRVPPMMMMMN